MNTIPLSPLKRVFDIIVSAILLTALAPFGIFFLLLCLLEQLVVPSARGPFFYKEIRISQGAPFTLRKIRTLKTVAITQALSNGVVHTKRLERGTNNFTLVGSLLHRIYLDEMPQLFSVFIGDMSIVGPRPTNTASYENGLTRGHRAKRILKAGLTGRFQTHKHVKYKLNQEQVDMRYAELCKTNSGLRIVMYDSYILLQTAATVLRAEGL
jgi:lipopolysaccharide/colanic/teichoic acid biosynthesis glycosyltransferase